MRTWNITAFFPEVKPAHLAHQSCTVPASEIATAARRGLKRLVEFEPLKGKHISIARLTVVAASKERKESE